MEDSGPKKRRNGRPSKVGEVNAILINLRISQEDHEALIEVGVESRKTGFPVPTVQDVIRRIIREFLTGREKS